MRAGTSTGAVLKGARHAGPLSYRGALAVSGIADLTTAIAPTVAHRPAPLADAGPCWALRQSADGPVHVAGHAYFTITGTTT